MKLGVGEWLIGKSGVGKASGRREPWLGARMRRFFGFGHSEVAGGVPIVGSRALSDDLAGSGFGRNGSGSVRSVRAWKPYAGSVAVFLSMANFSCGPNDRTGKTPCVDVHGERLPGVDEFLELEVYSCGETEYERVVLEFVSYGQGWKELSRDRIVVDSLKTGEKRRVLVQKRWEMATFRVNVVEITSK